MACLGKTMSNIISNIYATLEAQFSKTLSNTDEKSFLIKKACNV